MPVYIPFDVIINNKIEVGTNNVVCPRCTKTRMVRDSNSYE